MKAVITDLDGTLTTERGIIGQTNIDTLIRLGETGIIRIIATGRSLHSLHKIIPADFPVDFVIFTTGAGIIDWKTKSLIFEKNLPADLSERARRILTEEHLDFFVHFPVPDNHYYYYHYTGRDNPDFDYRYKISSEFSSPLTKELSESAAQLLTIVPENAIDVYDTLVTKLDFCKVIRTTSPLDDKTMWIEIFEKDVSKGSAADWLMNRFNVNKNDVIVIGNDFNDLDMLEWGIHSYVLANGPDELKLKYKPAKSNSENGFSDVINNNLLT